MAQIPTLDSLGARPVPRATRQIATVRNAGAVGDAAAQFGQTIGNIGQGMIEKEDKLNYAAAQAELLKADVTARAELENDPDYETFGQRYTDAMSKARENASKLIRSRSDRSLFEANSSVDFVRGKAEVDKLAYGKKVTAEKATLFGALDTLSDVGRDALDEPTRAATLTSASELIDGAIKKGLLDPMEGLKQKQQFAGKYVYTQINSMLSRDDYDSALKTFEANSDKLSDEQYLSVQGRLTDAGNFRQSVDDFNTVTGGAYSVDEGEGPSVGAMLNAISSNESGGKHYDARGNVQRSSAGAVGIMQVMPTTGPEAARLAGLEWDAKKFENDPAYNKALGNAYFKEMLRQFKDPSVAAAAYNAGPGAVQKALKKGGNWLQALPKETQDYVEKFRKKTGARQSSRTWDKESVYANIDALAAVEGWSPERVERTKKYADGQIARDEQLQARKEDTAMKTALDIVDRLERSGGFTDISQIPNFNELAPADKIRLRGMADSNKKAATDVKANGDTAIGLGLMAIRDPNAFMAEDIRKYRAEMTPAEFDSLVQKQAKMQEDGPVDVSIRSGITSTISLLATEDMKLTGRKADKSEYLRVYDIMATELRNRTGGKRTPTDAEYNEAFRSATRSVAQKYDTTFLGIPTGSKVKEIPRYKLDAEDVPDSVRAQITTDYRKVYGKDPDDDAIGDIYRKYKGVRW